MNRHAESRIARLQSKGFLRPEQIAARLHVHVVSVYRWVGNNEVISLKLGKARLIELDSAIELLSSRKSMLEISGVYDDELSRT